jgi:hypothetical protein
VLFAALSSVGVTLLLPAIPLLACSLSIVLFIHKHGLDLSLDYSHTSDEHPK